MVTVVVVGREKRGGALSAAMADGGIALGGGGSSGQLGAVIGCLRKAFPKAGNFFANVDSVPHFRLDISLTVVATAENRRRLLGGSSL